MTKDAKNPDVFSLLVKPVRAVLHDLGFQTPTLPQQLSISPLLKGENVLLIAPTGSGKTEAVLLPIFSTLIQQEDKRGISLIYLTPLRALNRDLLKRLSLWSSRLNISIEVRHGDTDLKLRRRQAIFPPQVLVTTPETLQAILPGSRMRQHLNKVQYVVVDEVHELASSKRGTQLTVALERLRELTGRDFQRIGLSATVGNAHEVAQFIAGASRPIRIVEAMPPKGYSYRVENPEPEDSDYDLAAKLKTAPEAAARLRRMMELIDSHESTLIFVNSRQNAEMLGHRFSQLNRMDIAVHHGSLSKEIRAQIEDEFKQGTLKAIICTSTLELGIDIGNVDLVIQYLSPRQVGSLIQRVGRSGHTLTRTSEGVIITAFPDDTLESSAAIRNALAGKIEPVLIHENALDVLAHQIVGILMDVGSLKKAEIMRLVNRSYPYRNLSNESFDSVIHFLEALGEIRTEEGDALKKTGKGRRYYYENLSMIPDERRYPVINVVSDRKIGTLGDEFMAFDARIGLNIIVHGKVWRIIQIEEETGTVYVIPAEDPFAAIPGWDGEMMPVPYELAQETGELRNKILGALKETSNAQAAVEKLSKELSSERSALLDPVKEVEEHVRQGAPLPTNDRIVIEAFDKYLIVHACFGEMVNRTFGSIFDAILSDEELIIGWWTDGYRILIEAPRKLSKQETETMPKMLFDLSDKEMNDAFSYYVKSKFPFGAKMKFIAQRFGALPRGKTLAEGRLAQLAGQFEDTPIYDETLREAMLEKVDLNRVKSIMHAIKRGKIRVRTVFRSEKPTPLAYHALAQYSDISELMAPEEVLMSNIDKMKKALNARTIRLTCMNCGEWSEETALKKLSERPSCGKCGSNLLALLYFSQDPTHLQESLRKRRSGTDLLPEELKELSHARRTADLILSYGKQAITALEVKGVGPETASRILGKMHHKEDDFYIDLLKAKIQYLKTRAFWDDKDKRKDY